MMRKNKMKETTKVIKIRGREKEQHDKKEDEGLEDEEDMRRKIWETKRG
jgi:hypothetical protein